MGLNRRTAIQIALLFIGIVVWGYGQRIDDSRLMLVGIGFFAAATIARFFRRGVRADRVGETGEDNSMDTDHHG